MSRLRSFASLSLLAGLALAACAAPPLPAYPWEGPEKALRILADRAASVRTVSATCTLVLSRPDGEGVSLDGAIAAGGTDRLRVRAWKFGHAVFDLTITPDGLWAWSAEDHPKAAEMLPPEVTAGRIADVWSRAGGALFRGRPLRVEDGGGPRFIAVFPLEPGTGVWACEIDRDTLTVRRCRVVDPSGRDRQTLSLERYAVVNGIVWPTRVQAVGEQGDITIEMDDVQLNSDLPPSAFTPPSRAVKKP